MKIVTLTLSAAFDIHCDIDGLVLNKENLAKITDYDAGGKGVNISRALRSFNTDSIAVVVLGDENRAEFEKKLKNENVSLQTLVVPGRIRENITVHTADGKETRISFTGTAAPADLLERIEKITDELTDVNSILTFTGSLPSGISVTDAKAYIKRLISRGVRVVIDSHSFTIDDLIEVKPFLIKPNEEEISHYMGREISDRYTASEVAEELRDKGIENVMISLGAAGAVIASPKGSFAVNAPKIEAVSTIGAGDSSIAGFIYALERGENIAEALRTAVAFGSAACLTSGTKPPSKADVQRLLAYIK